MHINNHTINKSFKDNTEKIQTEQ